VAAHYQERQELTDALNGLRVLQLQYDLRVQQYGEPRQRKLGWHCCGHVFGFVYNPALYAWIKSD